MDRETLIICKGLAIAMLGAFASIFGLALQNVFLFMGGLVWFLIGLIALFSALALEEIEKPEVGR